MCLLHWPSDVLCFHHLDPAKKKFGLKHGVIGQKKKY
jgi:hypothetical protein